MSNDELICQVCRKEGHKRGLIVKTSSGLRNLRYCLCCGRVLRSRKGAVTPARSRQSKGRKRGRQPLPRAHR